jgi:hypothetical protein
MQERQTERDRNLTAQKDKLKGRINGESNISEKEN